jgi:hypothetical protein
MRIKVRGGTVAHDTRQLCETCRWSTIIRGVRTGEEIVACRELAYENNRVPFPVVSCTRYVDSNHPTIREMEEMAWLLRTEPHRKQAGFVHASRLTEDERHVLDED